MLGRGLDLGAPAPALGAIVAAFRDGGIDLSALGLSWARALPAVPTMARAPTPNPVAAVASRVLTDQVRVNISTSEGGNHGDYLVVLV